MSVWVLISLKKKYVYQELVIPRESHRTILSLRMKGRVLKISILSPPCAIFGGFAGGASGKESTCRIGKRCAFDPWVRKIPLEKGIAPDFSILAWRIPWTEEPGGLQSMGSQRVRRN